MREEVDHYQACSQSYTTLAQSSYAIRDWLAQSSYAMRNWLTYRRREQDERVYQRLGEPLPVDGYDD